MKRDSTGGGAGGKDLQRQRLRQIEDTFWRHAVPKEQEDCLEHSGERFNRPLLPM